MENEKDIEEIVKKWVKDNYAEFNEGGKPNGKELYRKSVFKRCKQFQNAPTKYLKDWLETSKTLTKWYLNILQTILTGALVAISTALFYLFIDNILKWIETLTLYWNEILILSWTEISFLTSMFVSWFVPLIILIVLVILTIEKNEDDRSYLVHFIQARLGILQNLKEILIEKYYITKILEIRKSSKLPNEE